MGGRRVAPGIRVIEQALARPLLARLLGEVAQIQRTVGTGTMARWNAMALELRQTFWYPFSQRPRMVIEEALRSLRRHAALGTRATGVEWWFNVIRPDARVHQHFDKDESLKASTGKLRPPRLASILYLSNVGCPTVIQNVRPSTVYRSRLAAAPRIQVFVPPRVNRYAVFTGDRLHGAAPPVGDEERYSSAADDDLRIVLAVNYWRDKPMAPYCIELADRDAPTFYRRIAT